MRKHLSIIFIFTILFSCQQNEEMGTKRVFKKYKDGLSKLQWESPLDSVAALLKPSIKIDFIQKNKAIKTGHSKFGGKPDLPKAINWPTNKNDEPMIFIGQINFQELTKYDIDSLLPKTGIVYFFIHFNKPENEFGTEYQFIFDKQDYSVIYSEGTNLVSKDFPTNLPKEYYFNEVAVNYNLFYSFPHRSIILNKIGKQASETSEEFNEQYGNHEGEQLLGYPMAIQDDVAWDWAFSEMEFETYELSKEDHKKIDKQLLNYTTLLQFSLDNRHIGLNKIGISIGYFGITIQNLREKKFENSILVFQDT